MMLPNVLHYTRKALPPPVQRQGKPLLKFSAVLSAAESGKDDGPNTECFQAGEMMAQPLGARTALVKDPSSVTSARNHL